MVQSPFRYALVERLGAILLTVVLLVGACAPREPAQIVVPETAPENGTAAETRLTARVGVSYERLTDSHVVKKVRTRYAKRWLPPSPTACRASASCAGRSPSSRRARCPTTAR